MSLYFIFLFWVTKPAKREGTAVGVGGEAVAATAAASASASAETPAEASAGVEATLAPTATSLPPLGVTKESISYALTAACVLCLCGELLSKVAFGGRVSAM